MAAFMAPEQVQSIIDYGVPMLCQSWRNAELVIWEGSSERQLIAQMLGKDKRPFDIRYDPGASASDLLSGNSRYLAAAGLWALKE